MSGLPLPPGVWKFDTGHTQVGFSVRHLGISTVHGLFLEYDGQADIGSDLASSTVELTANTQSVTTGNTWRDGHLVGPDFFDSEHFPSMIFRSGSITEAGDGYVLDGELTVKDVTGPVSFRLEFYGTNVFPPDETTHAGFQATATILRSEFGVGYGIPIASDEVGIRIDAQLVAPG